MKLLLFLLLTVQGGTSDCASELTLHGVGASAAAQVRPYASCLNANFLTQERLLSVCQEARTNAARYRGPARSRAQVRRALGWLDAMTRERANCETVLRVAR
jgi:hypothetical protein